MAAVDWGMITGWIATVLSAGAAAYFGAYLRTRAERRAIIETMNMVERKAADITEAAKLRWSKRTEVCATLYGQLVAASREFRLFFSPATRSTKAAIDRLCERAKAFDDFYAENALFLPREVKHKTEWIAEQMLECFNITSALLPLSARLESPQNESAADKNLSREHYKRKPELLKRFQDGGDISRAIAELEAKLRSALDIE